MSLLLLVFLGFSGKLLTQDKYLNISSSRPFLIRIFLSGNGKKIEGKFGNHTFPVRIPFL